MPQPVENVYFDWLCAKVSDSKTISPSRSFVKLFRVLHTTEFAWTLSGDDNRAEDGKELRGEFLLLYDIPDDPLFRMQPCSMLEMFISFGRRAEWETGDSASDWFWEFMKNLGLDYMNDAACESEQDIVDVLDTLIWRTYRANGEGGMFPLRRTTRDQRGVEIWYQFCDYLVDQDRLP